MIYRQYWERIREISSSNESIIYAQENEADINFDYGRFIGYGRFLNLYRTILENEKGCLF